jgi:hypothetical protein
MLVGDSDVMVYSPQLLLRTLSEAVTVVDISSNLAHPQVLADTDSIDAMVRR